MATIAEKIERIRKHVRRGSIAQRDLIADLDRVLEEARYSSSNDLPRKQSSKSAGKRKRDESSSSSKSEEAPSPPPLLPAHLRAWTKDVDLKIVWERAAGRSFKNIAADVRNLIGRDDDDAKRWSARVIRQRHDTILRKQAAADKEKSPQQEQSD